MFKEIDKLLIAKRTGKDRSAIKAEKEQGRNKYVYKFWQNRIHSPERECHYLVIFSLHDMIDLMIQNVYK